MLNSVIFDIDDTLYDQLVPFAEACSHFPNLDKLPLDALFRARSIHGMEALRRMNAGSFTLAENHIYRMVMACREFGTTITDKDALDFQQAYDEAQRHLTVTPGMVQVLDLCRSKGWFLGVLTNGPSDHQRQKFHVLGLERWISPSHIVVSGDCGFLKPDLKLFQFTERKLGLSPAATLMVGDSFDNDIQGATAAGWQSFWLQRTCPGKTEKDLLDLLSQT